MSGDDPIEWIAPADAEQLLGSLGQISSPELRERILQRAREGLIRARVRDVVKRTLAKAAESEKPEPDERGVYPIGNPLLLWEWPIEKERRSDVALKEDDWLAVGLSDAANPWWQTGDLELNAASGTREGLSMFGIEFCKADIERMRPARATATLPAKAPSVSTSTTSSSAAIDLPKRLRVSAGSWDRWVEQYKRDHPTLPNVDRTIYPAAKVEFGNAVTQAMCRDAFGGNKPGPRSKYTPTQ